MDLSVDYLKMCKKSNIEWEIPTIGVAHIKEGALFYYGENVYVKVVDELIPLYRQDQLQSLCGNIFPPYTTLIKNVAYYCADNEAYWDCFDSGEQFWLAYYMATKQGKHWNGEEWAKE